MEKKAVALLANDLHASKENIEEFNKNWKELLEVAGKYKVERILIGGDLFTSRSSQTLSVLLAVHDFMQYVEGENFSILLANGNHDKVDQKANFGYCDIFIGMPQVNVVDGYRMACFGKICVTMIDYFPENDGFLDVLREAERYVQRGYSDRDHYLYIHEGIIGGLSSPSETDLPSNVFDSIWKRIFVGHYHNRRKIAGTNIEYIGASRQHNYGEDDMKGYTILFSDGSTEFVQNQVNTRYVTVEATYDQIMSDDFRSCLEGASKENTRVKVKVSCDPSQVSTVNREELADLGVAKVEFMTDSANIKEAAQQSLVERFDKSGLIDSYKNYCADNKVDNVDLGVSYLNKINAYVGS